MANNDKIPLSAPLPLSLEQERDMLLLTPLLGGGEEDVDNAPVAIVAVAVIGERGEDTTAAIVLFVFDIWERMPSTPNTVAVLTKGR